ncbi:hypothetical protein [Mucilaginibacter sp.]
MKSDSKNCPNTQLNDFKTNVQITKNIADEHDNSGIDLLPGSML